ncbi:AAA family ATPase [Nocardioides lentus]|uniref:AAA family ATPase n=2 Tax=Nocardioides lentus TaxID=338077 RepID=A0ABP5AEI5_9ACTN
MQPFLLMKQTLDSAFDPGPLLLYGANVKVTEYEQILSRGKAKTDVSESFAAGLRQGSHSRVVRFKQDVSGAPKIDTDVVIDEDEGNSTSLSQPLTPKQRKALGEIAARRVESLAKMVPRFKASMNLDWEVEAYRNRCFLEPVVRVSEPGEEGFTYRFGLATSSYDDDWVDLLRGIIHVPGLRGNPERSYPRSAVGETWPGTFETYVASILFEWGKNKPERLTALAHDLEQLGLTWKVMARRVNDASVEVMVGRMPHSQQGGAWDLVSVADVGFGVSQTLPVLVALHSAKPGQIVYIEQPEIHLHPRAQLALADCLVAAAKRGVLVIAETHSSLLIRGLQIAVAQKHLSPENVSMNWFSRDPDDGSQEITVADLDAQGRFGEWPLDFDDISREADWAYLDAVEAAE